MKYIDLKKARFHDMEINEINYKNNALMLNVSNVDEEKPDSNFVLTIFVDEEDFSVYYARQRPWFRNVKFKGREITLNHLKKLLEKQKTVKVVESFVSTDCNIMFLSCVLFPCSKGRGVYKKILLTINCARDYAIIGTGNI